MKMGGKLVRNIFKTQLSIGNEYKKRTPFTTAAGRRSGKTKAGGIFRRGRRVKRSSFGGAFGDILFGVVESEANRK